MDIIIKYKKIICIMLATVWLAALFAGCSKEVTNLNNKDNSENFKQDIINEGNEGLNNKDKKDKDEDRNENKDDIDISNGNSNGKEKVEDLEDLEEDNEKNAENNSNIADKNARAFPHISFEDGEEEIYFLSQPNKSVYEYVQGEGVTDGSRAIKITVNSLNKTENGPFSELVIENDSEGWDFGEGSLKLDVLNPENYIQQVRVMITDEAGTIGYYYFTFQANESRTLEIDQFEQHEAVLAGDGFWGLTQKGLDKTKIKKVAVCLWEYHPSLRDDTANVSSFIIDNIRVN